MPSKFRLLLPVMLAVLLALSSPVQATPEIYSDESDGYVTSTGVVHEGSLQQMSVGDWDTNGYGRGFVKFGLSGISETLISARLYLYVWKSLRDGVQDSTDPLSNPGLGDCQVIHIADYATLDASDFNAPSIANDPGVLIPGTGAGSAPNVGYVSIDVKAAMQDDLNKDRYFSAFMIRLATDTDSNNDNDYWEFRTSEQTGTDQDPYIEYEIGSACGTTTTTTATTTATSTKWTTTTTTTTSTSTSPTVTVTTSTVVGTLTSYYFTVSTDTTVYVRTTESTTSSYTTSITLTETYEEIVETTRTTTKTLTLTSTTALGRCVIASAAYGSELAPQVQYLREFRDRDAMNTFTGTQFMKVFNAFYYSFSPTLAEFISKSSSAMTLTRVLVAPLIGSLQIGQAVASILMPHPNSRIVVAGVISSSLIGMLYTSPVLAISAAKTDDERRRRGTPLKYLALVWIGSLFALTLSIVMHYSGEVIFSDFIAMVSSGTLVLSTMILAPLLLLKLIRRLLH